MSSFKRLANLARGKLLEIQGSLEGTLAPVDEPEQGPHLPAEDPSDPRELLEKLRTAGLLTDEEYAEKSASLEEPTTHRPMKRTL